MIPRPGTPRSTGRPRALPLLVLLLALAAPRAGTAQELRLSAARVQTSDPLWGNPHGWAMAVHMPASDRLSFLVGVSAFSSRQARVGSSCAGPAPPLPSGCAPEQLKDLARLLDIRLGFAGRVMQREKLSMSIVADGHWIEGTSDTNAPASRRNLSATEGYWGPGVGLDVTWKPNPTGALGFFATGEAVWWIPRNSEATKVDGYEPFNETVRAPSFSLGASWAVRVF